MGLPHEVPHRSHEADQVSYLEYRALCADREAEAAEVTAQDGGDLAFARLRRRDAAALRRLAVAGQDR